VGRRSARLLVVTCAALLALFGLAVATGVEGALGGAAAWVGEGGAAAALLSVGLLWADVALPIPSTPLLVANGAAFGLLPGALVSLVGGVGATLLAWRLGRLYEARRSAGAGLERAGLERAGLERTQAERYLTRWGGWAIVLTRPIPILAEAVALLAGTLPLSACRVALYALIGHILPCFGYAYMGACLRSAL